MEDYILRIRNEFKDNPDLIIKENNINLHKLYVIFLETLTSSDKINDYILKKITNLKIYKNLLSILPSSNIKILNKYDEIEYYLYNGFTIILDKNKIYAIETKAEIWRSINETEIESSLKGPKNSFNENYQINLGLIKRRIKSSHLKVKNINIGRISNTNVGLLYIDNIVKDKYVTKIYKKLSNIDIDLLNDVSELQKYICNKSILPNAIITERPDRTSEALSQGKIVLICDESPYALIIPAFLIDFINPFSDRYNINFNINFTKIIRFLCFFLSILFPAFYIAIVNYNQETIPSSLIVNFAIQKDGVPFPSLIECLILLIFIEILRESDLRFPNKYGSAISILGALIIGEAAVNAGLVSSIMIIICSFTYVSSLIFPEIELGNAIRYYRFISLLGASLLGFYGLILAFLYLLVSITDSISLDIPYSFPLSPFDKSYFKDFFFKLKNYHRSKFLTNNLRKEK